MTGFSEVLNMDSSSVRRLQTLSKVHSNFQRSDNEQNKHPADVNHSKCIPAIQDDENKAPAECALKPPLKQGTSRIPVLAKTVCLQASSDFKKSYNKWEEKPLSVKVKRKRQFTRSVPFNLSKPNKTQNAAKVCKPLTAQASLKHHLSSVPDKMVQNKGNSAQPGPGAEVALDNMNLLSLKEPSKSSNAESLTVPRSSLKALNDKKNVQQDAALLCVTPQSKPYNDLPQRVSVKKSQRKAGTPAGPVRCVQFSPDFAALQSILQNEGLKAGGLLGAMSRDSFCPSNRGTSIYTAQRVPVKQSKAKTKGGPVAAVKESLLTKGTPQRVCNNKHQPVSSMKCFQSPFTSPGNGTWKLNLQRLLDVDDEQSTAGPGEDPKLQTEKFPVQGPSNNSYSTECRTKGDDVEEELKTLPAQPRQSVIFFSTKKKQLRVQSSDLKDSAQLDPVSADQRNRSGACGETSADEPAHPSNQSVLRLHRDLCNQKASLSSAVVMLRKRFPTLEELRLDDEVSTYTSKSVTVAPRFPPPQPRCENPLASILHFEEHTRFIPICFDLPDLRNSKLQR